MRDLSTVMPGLVPGIHVLGVAALEDVDGRVKPGHDESGSNPDIHALSA
jgi:hypothetical protein